MEDISNRTLALFLIAAIVVSVGGTLMVLNAAGPAGFAATGYAVNETPGYVLLNVSSAVSIYLNDTTIDFGTCTLGGLYTMYVNSNSSNTTYNNSICTLTGWGSNGYDRIQLQNLGNIYSKVEVNASVNSSAFFSHTTSPQGSSFLRIFATETNNSCSGTLATAPFNLSATTYDNICTNFSKTAQAEMLIWADAYMVPDVSSTSQNMTLTFKATVA